MAGFRGVAGALLAAAGFLPAVLDDFFCVFCVAASGVSVVAGDSSGTLGSPDAEAAPGFGAGAFGVVRFCAVDLCAAGFCAAGFCAVDLCAGAFCVVDLCAAGVGFCAGAFCADDLCAADLCAADLCAADLCAAGFRAGFFSAGRSFDDDALTEPESTVSLAWDSSRSDDAGEGEGEVTDQTYQVVMPCIGASPILTLSVTCENPVRQITKPQQPLSQRCRREGRQLSWEQA
ncbi:hypothetical protein GCM10027416_12630 [Okibacterium endophyticum]